MPLDLNRQYKINFKHPDILSVSFFDHGGSQQGIVFRVKHSNGNIASYRCCDKNVANGVFTIKKSWYSMHNSGNTTYHMNGYSDDYVMEVPDCILVPATKIKYNPYKGKSYE